MRSKKPTNQDRLNSAKSVENLNFSRTSRSSVLLEEVARILANIAPTTKQRSDVD